MNATHDIWSASTLILKKSATGLVNVATVSNSDGDRIAQIQVATQFLWGVFTISCAVFAFFGLPCLTVFLIGMVVDTLNLNFENLFNRNVLFAVFVGTLVLGSGIVGCFYVVWSFFRRRIQIRDADNAIFLEILERSSTATVNSGDGTLRGTIRIKLSGETTLFDAVGMPILQVIEEGTRDHTLTKTTALLATILSPAFALSALVAVFIVSPIRRIRERNFVIESISDINNGEVAQLGNVIPALPMSRQIQLGESMTDNERSLVIAAVAILLLRDF